MPKINNTNSGKKRAKQLKLKRAQKREKKQIKWYGVENA